MRTASASSACLLAAAASATVAVFTSPALASHTSQTYDFTGQVFGNTSVDLAVMDALPSGPDGNSSPRTVVLGFELKLLGTWYGNLPGLETPFEVTGNDELLLRTTFSTLLGGLQSYPGSHPEDSYPLGGITMVPITLTFPLDYVPDCCTDIVVRLERTGTDTMGSWALHDVSLDWSKPIPEPAPALTFGIGLAALALRARGPQRRHRLDCGHRRHPAQRPSSGSRIDRRGP